MMESIRVIASNTFAELSSNNIELNINVFDRVFRKLLNEGGPLGKVQPVYLRLGRHIKTLGVITLNKNGSYSFFPEMADTSEFDHMTFNKDLKRDKHHYTRVIGSKREKILPITAEELTNGVYHVATIVFRNQSILKSAPKEIIYPEVPISRLEEIKSAFITEGKLEGVTIIELKSEIGSICIQLFLVPRHVDYSLMSIYSKPFRWNQPDFELQDGTYLFNAIIPHEYQKEYSLGILSFMYEKGVNQDIQIITSSKRDGFYSKTKITSKTNAESP